ncbi:MAG TPA: cytochrome d ubiquinol oxidase subunit II [Vicinamibacterales bacterium]|nr:cytochrome d ubiquinol oxidase subunit II [Vicinamibacterales bacterium]
MIADATLPVIWFFIITGELALYALLDGANLGIGLLSMLPQPEDRRGLMLHTLGPIWNANETWLLVAAGSLFGAFPAVYSVTLNALYIPGMAVVIGLILRAVSFEFYDYGEGKWLWGDAFGVGSLLTVLGQGALFGGLLSGIRTEGQQFAGGPFDWVTPVTLLVMVGVFFGYVIVGYANLIRKTGYEVAGETFPRILGAGIITLIALTGASLLLPREYSIFLVRWTTPPTNFVLFGLAALIVAAFAVVVWNVTRQRDMHLVFPLCQAIFVLGYVGVLVGIYPYMVPPSLTLFDVASPPNTLRFMLYGIGPLLPIVLAYNWYLAHVFRVEAGGKASKGISGY